MAKKFCKQTAVADLKKGDRVLVATPYSKQCVGYVESINDMQDGTKCAYLDIRWRSLRAKTPHWTEEPRDMPAGQKFCLVFNHDTLYVTNMSLSRALARLNIKPFQPTDPDCPF